MSLHLGNLSSHVRRDELERVFRRFGRCDIQLMDKYGFAVYDISANAEKALQTLRGKNICGEPITVSWSNIQPRGSVRRFARGGRTYESGRGRSSVREDYGNRILDSSRRWDYRMSANRPDGDGRRVESFDRDNEVTNYHKENINTYIGEKDHNVRDDVFEEGKKQVDHLANDKGVESELHFEQHEPYHSDHNRDDTDGIHHSTSFGGSPDLKKSQENMGTEKTENKALIDPENGKFQKTCFTCGNFGHKMRNCPVGNAVSGKKFSGTWRRYDYQYNNRDEGGLRKPRSNSRGRQQPGRNVVPVQNHKSYRKNSSSRKHRTIRSEHTPLAKETHRSQGEEHHRKKRRQREKRSPVRRKTKKARGQESSPVHSYSPAHKSGSRSKSESGFTLQSRLQSESSKSGSLSSTSTSDSTSHSSRLENSKINLTSRSSSPIACSLHVSPGRTSPSSPNKVQTIKETPFINPGSTTREVLVEKEQQLEGVARTCDFNLDSAKVAVENQSALTPFEVDEDKDVNGSLSDRKDDYQGTKRDTHEAVNLEQGHLDAGGLSTQAFPDVMGVEKTQDSAGQNQFSISSTNLHSGVAMRSRTLTSITPEEMYKALEHYGIERTEEHFKDLPVEAFFGSARLWPWEIIYYRRLKKGPISIENYELRVSQNKEFGIVDKYIRSSSGWGELSEDSP